MSINVEIIYDGANELTFLTEALANKPAMHERIAREALLFVREFGAKKSQTEHRTANMLGANPTGHLARAYAGIEAAHDATSARLLVPRASRLRAAFGAYTLKPQKSQYLTLPIHKDAYGRRAREFEDLDFARMGGADSGTGSQAFLLRRNDDGSVDFMYFLTKSANIKEDASLIPFEQIYNEAGRAVEAYLDEAIERSLA
jgi:hypothetical protein